MFFGGTNKNRKFIFLPKIGGAFTLKSRDLGHPIYFCENFECWKNVVPNVLMFYSLELRILVHVEQLNDVPVG